MNRIAAALAATLLATTTWAGEAGEAAHPAHEKCPCACAREGHASKKASAGHAAEGKPTAPVTVQASLDAGAGTARVTVQFGADATDVSIAVRGVDGLQVSTPASPLTAAAVAGGEVKALDVTFTPGPGRSHLAVSVSGRFGGARRIGVSTFAVGEPSAAQKARPGQTLTDAQGRGVKALPADTK